MRLFIRRALSEPVWIMGALWPLTPTGRSRGPPPAPLRLTAVSQVSASTGDSPVQAERTPPYRDSQQVIVAERSQGSFARQLSLGEGVDSQNLTADYADGVLHVTIPASPKTRARRVKVTHAAGGSRIVPGSTVEPGEAPAGSTGGAAG